MSHVSHWSLALVLTGSLGAQSLPEALAMVPTDASSVAILREAGATDLRFREFTKRFGKGSSFEEWEAHFGRDLAGFRGGPALVVERKAKGQKEPVDLLIAPTAGFQALVKELKAVPQGKLYTFKRGEKTFFLASRSGFAFLSKDRDLVLEMLQVQGGLAATLGPRLPWMQTQDIVGVIPEKAFHEGLASAKADLEKPDEPEKSPLPSNKATKAATLRALEALDASASCFAFSLSLPEDRSLRGSARLFLRPGTPMASWTPTAAVHPLQGMPNTPFALAFGGPASQPLAAWISDILQPLLQKEMAPEDLKSLKALQAELQGNLRSATWVIGVPVAPGRGLLSGTTGVLRVENPGAYMDTLARITRQRATLAGGEAGPVFRPNVLPSVPSALISSPIPGEPSTAVFSGLLFGGPSIDLGLAQADEHTLVAALGSPETLQRALESFRTPVGTLDLDKGIQAVDASLPADAPWRLYVHPGGLRDFAQSLFETLPILPGNKALPKVDSAPPMGLALRMDSQSIDLNLALPGETLDAVGKWGKAMEELFPKQPAKATKKAKGRRES
ncbi:MAG: hypothetical protein H6Q00_286 [Holophagaceae bacterium]|nr:hypothetical protein [Holophagaceae bacterium]